MKKQVAIFFLSFLCIKALVVGYSLELNASYDYFRGIPEESWNGNTGALVGANSGINVFDCVGLQLGGSYGVYNWDGRGNVVFSNTKKVEQIGFVTAGASTSMCNWNAGIVYDRMFTDNFSIYSLSPSFDQLRFQVGYQFCSDEVGVWGTSELSTAHKNALGLPVSYKAIGQMNVFWSHFFENCSQTTIWLGTPYQKSLMFPHGRAGNFIAGFSFRMPLTERLFLDGNGSYMVARTSHGVVQSCNYGSNICVGITYNFSDDGFCCESPYMPIANHSNFFVDTNVISIIAN